tara:strand:- start:6864 stop:7568 length:705 start_codon:yes stop_codon:yes gene_type:complete
MEYTSKLDNKTKIILKTSNNVFAPTATSDFLIKAVANNISNVNSLLDLGCGNGIVGITLSKFNKAKMVYFSDISKEAVKITNENIKLNNCIGNAIYSDIFSNWDSNKFNVIVDDISGISQDVARLSNWFKNIPCDSGEDGCKNIEKVLNQASNYLVEKGIIFFPIISLSNTKKILNIAELNFKKIIKISHNEWFLPDEIGKHFDLLNSLKDKGVIDYCQRFGKLICWTDIYMAS